jgi:ABC-type nitrate/sulfonate/bicarbonate transport system substrate-binding protein
MSNPAPPRGAAAEAVYTICPVFTASAVAAELGWLQEAFEEAGVPLRYLRALPASVGFLPHFTHSLDTLIRDGGNIPALWAHGDVQPTTLVGLTVSPLSGHLAVRARDGLRRVEDLRGRRIGLPTNPDPAKVDWYRATAHRGALVSLALHGLGPKDVLFVDVPNPERIARAGAFERPSQVWLASRGDFGGVEEQALADGRVDAIFVRSGRAQALEATGRFALLEDLAARPDSTLTHLNSPWTIAVGRRLADERPEAVVAYLRAAIRAARWIEENPEAAAEVFTRVSFFRTPEEALPFVRGVDFTPNLSPKALAGLEIQKQFLLDHGYLRHDFDVRAWADGRFLAEALGGAEAAGAVRQRGAA